MLLLPPSQYNMRRLPLHRLTIFDASPPPIAPFPADESVPPSSESIAENSYPLQPERIWYPRDWGLDNGWGPTALFKTCSSMYIYTPAHHGGTPSLIAILVRLVLMKGYINAADTSAWMAILTPDIAQLKAHNQAAQQISNKVKLGRLAQELRNLYKAPVSRYGRFSSQC